ncbi:beta-galactosidase, partial [Streptosporangium roseum]
GPPRAAPPRAARPPPPRGPPPGPPPGERAPHDTGTFWSEHVHLEGAEALALYAVPEAPAPGSPGPHALRAGAPETGVPGAALAGLPAITRHRHGRGTALYLSTRLTDGAYARLLGLRPAPLERVRRGGWLFTINHGDEEQEGTGGLRLSPGGYAVQKVQAGV